MVTTDKFLSIKIARFLMKIVGFWTVDTQWERNLLLALQKYTLFALGCAIWVEVSDFLASVGDFYALTYVACSTMPVVIVLVKVTTFLYHEEKMLKLLRYTEKNFWYAEYDEYGRKILEKAERKALVLITMFTFFVHGTVFCYMLAPMIGAMIVNIFIKFVHAAPYFFLENIGKNESDRVLPFNIYLGVPVSISPYFEIAYAVEIIALIHSGLCFCCFDNFFGLLNIHVAAQFKILGHRVEELFNKSYEDKSDMSKDQQIYEEFKKCVSEHRKLISYINNMEHIFSYATLCQLLVSSVMLCVAGFQVFKGQGTLLRRLIFISHTNGTFFQIFVTTLTANDVMFESSAIGDYAYNLNWESSLAKTNEYMKYGILMLMLRSSRMCCITAGGFFPVSLETFTTVLSTAASYFTLLQKFDLDLEGK